jgi:hypothetical protein
LRQRHPATGLSDDSFGEAIGAALFNEPECPKSAKSADACAPKAGTSIEPAGRTNNGAIRRSLAS